MLDGKFLIAEEKYKMIINKKEIVCFGNHSRVYFKDKGYLCSALKSKKKDAVDNGEKVKILKKVSEMIDILDNNESIIIFKQKDKILMRYAFS